MILNMVDSKILNIAAEKKIKTAGHLAAATTVHRSSEF